MADFLDDIVRASLRRRSYSRQFRAAVRDTWVLIREFRTALILFTLTMLIGGAIFQALWLIAHPSDALGFPEALYDVLGITFFQPPIDFPDQWYLQIFLFLMPALGLAFLAMGAADFVTLLFNRSSRFAKWEEAVASVYSDHIIVCGLGHLGVRVIRELILWDEDIVVIEAKQENARVGEIRKYEIPIIFGDARHHDVLERAGIDRAKAVVVCTNDDLVNIQMASRIREQNKSLRLVMRMFDDEFARSMADRFDISSVMSASLLAAPAFAGAAAGVEIVQMFHVAEKVLAMGRVIVAKGSRLEGMIVSEMEDALDLSVVLLQSGDIVDVHPEPNAVLHNGNSIAVVGTPASIKSLASYNQIGRAVAR
jgi:Trk K+ transport system NAD-binding subunit